MAPSQAGVFHFPTRTLFPEEGRLEGERTLLLLESGQ
jgi:hypothetical protein